MFQCLIFLDDPQAVSDILEKLVKEDNLLMAYQICFDLYESASQQFLSSVIQNLRTVGTPLASVPGSTNTYITKSHVMFLHCSFLCVTVFRNSSQGETLSQVSGSGHASLQ